MKALVIYDSKYGNTALLAAEITNVLKRYAEVRTLRAMDVDSDIFDGVDLLAVGGPTQGHGLSAELKGLFEATATHVKQGSRPMVLAFDTRMNWPKWLSGSAADKIARFLEEMGCPMLAQPESFLVDGGEGPLAEGEKERAIAWAQAAIERM